MNRIIVEAVMAAVLIAVGSSIGMTAQIGAGAGQRAALNGVSERVLWGFGAPDDGARPVVSSIIRNSPLHII